MKKPVIFLSHSKPNKDFVRQLSEKLKKDGIDVWFDELEIKIGESIHQKVNDGLKKSDFFAIVLSMASVKSKWVQEELSSASSIEKYQKKGIFILPILLEKCDVPPLLLDRRYANFVEDESAAYSELVDSVYHHFKLVHPEVDISSIKTQTIGDNLYKRILENSEVLNQIPPRLFEELIATILTEMGFNVELASISKDGGADIIAFQQSLPGLKTQKFVIQCKRYKNTIGVHSIRELAGIKIFDKFERAMLVTTSDFTRDAKEFANLAGIDLVDGNLIHDWIRKLALRNE